MTEFAHGVFEQCPVILVMGRPGDRILVRGEEVVVMAAAANPCVPVITPPPIPFTYTIEVQPDCSVRKVV